MEEIKQNVLETDSQRERKSTAPSVERRRRRFVVTERERRNERERSVEGWRRNKAGAK